MADADRCPDGSRLGDLVRGLLPPGEASVLASHVEACEPCAARAAAIAAEVAAKTRGPQERLPPPAATSVGGGRPWPSVLAIVAGVALVIAIVGRGREPEVIPAATPPAPPLRVHAFARTGEEIREVRERAALRPGDRIRLAVDPPTNGYLYVVSLDGRGEVRPLVPPGGERSRPLRRADRGFLEDLLAVASSTEVERLFALFSERPLALDEVRRAAAAGLEGARSLSGLSRLPLDATRQWTLLLERAR